MKDEQSKARRTDVAIWLVAIIIFALKFPLRSRLLSWWDSAQFGLALERFSVVEHRPHPPGYPLYILTGKILTYITRDPNLSFVLIGLICSAIALIFIFRIAREISGRTSTGWLAVAVYAFAPLTFYHELKALTYVIGAFFSAFAAWEALRIVKGQEKNPYRIAIVLGVMGMIRPYESILLIPLAIWSVARLGWRKLINASAIYAILQVAWIIPTALLSGGFKPYFSELLAESGKHERNIEALTRRPIAKFAINVRAVYYYMRQSFPVWGFLAFVPIVSSFFQFSRRKREILFFILWLAPALILYSVNNVNYAGIPLFISPALSLMIAFGIDKIAGLIVKTKLRIGGTLNRPVLASVFAIIISLHFLIIFFSVDVMILGERYRKYDPDGFNYIKKLAGDGYVYFQINGVNNLAKSLGSEDSVIILSDLNYRVLEYYLPDYRIIWTRYISQKESNVNGKTKLALNRQDSYIQLPGYEFNGKKYWYYKIQEGQKAAVFTDEMLPNLSRNSRFSILPGSEAAKAYMLDLDGEWGIYFSFGEFGAIDNETARKLGLEK